MLYLVFQMKSTNFAFVIELERHIEILLLKSDCVIVPGLGGFVASHVNARYDEDDNMFIPPLRTLGFNPKLTLNDSLLAQSYSEAYDISYPEACGRIDNEVNELKQYICNNGSYFLNGIGTLSMNGYGNYEFVPCEAGILTPDLYSLSSFEMGRLSKSESVDVNNGKAEVIAFPAHDFVERNKRGVALRDGDSGKTLQIRISAIRNFAAAMIAVVLFLVLGTPVNESNGLRTSNIDNGVIESLISNGYNNIIRSNGHELGHGVKRQDTMQMHAAVKADKNAEAANVARSDSFYIVIASRVTKNNAEDFVDRLADDGFEEASVLVEKNKSVKVVYGRYANEGEAYGALDKLRGNALFRDAWVYRINN